jgi:hypothetical protein
MRSLLHDHASYGLQTSVNEIADLRIDAATHRVDKAGAVVKLTCPRYIFTEPGLGISFA